MNIPRSSSNSGPGLKRVLGLSSLVLYGIIVIQPTAPMPLFGAVVGVAHGHAVTTIFTGHRGFVNLYSLSRLKTIKADYKNIYLKLTSSTVVDQLKRGCNLVKINLLAIKHIKK